MTTSWRARRAIEWTADAILALDASQEIPWSVRVNDVVSTSTSHQWFYVCKSGETPRCLTAF